MRLNLRVVVYAVTVTAMSACGGVGASQSGGPKDNAESLSSQAAVATTAANPSGSAVPPTTQPSKPVAMVDFKLPDFKGMNLQDAQNKVQEFGIFFSRSHDLRGSRNQLIDSNWQVCTQSPRAGTQIKGTAAEYEGKIDFGVVKLTETCP